MRPPTTRRLGSSRKAQYGFLFGYVVAVAGILIAMLLLAVAIIDPRGFAAIRGAALDGTAPVSAGGRSVSRFFSDIGSGIGNYFRAGSQNAQLRRDLEEARRGLVDTQATAAENARLRALLGLAREVQDEIAVARIVGSSYDSARRLATLSAGSSSGVRVGQPVRAADGLIGRVLETGRWASRVLLVSDGASSVPVRSLRDDTPALAVGRGDGSIELRTLEVGSNPFRRGDVLVTSGVGGIFPPNVPVATVIRIEGDSAIARPIADPSRVDMAIVQPVYQAGRRRRARRGRSRDGRAARHRAAADRRARRPHARPAAAQPALPAGAAAAAAGPDGAAAARRRGAGAGPGTGSGSAAGGAPAAGAAAGSEHDHTGAAPAAGPAGAEVMRGAAPLTSFQRKLESRCLCGLRAPPSVKIREIPAFAGMTGSFVGPEAPR